MPKIDESKIKNFNKKFKKVPYRPWDMEAEEKTSVIQKESHNKEIEENFTDNGPELNTLKEETERLEKEIRRLYGLQMNIIHFFLKKFDKEDELYIYTNPTSHSDLIEYTHSPRSSIAVALTRLKAKGLLSTAENKPGRGGFAIYKLPKNLRNIFKEKNF